ncbi:MAG: tRNA preQ1(34) S-adenosylmethionine ribosyltransferase-isomerase QueA [Sedimentisphaerales bacterium]|nr:tRNA preQ1(34) S-adenosylmethionine ribosyltransferase-isomerase QueA [Sedimentisphaerales bacterium]
MNTDQLDYQLPSELIAQDPVEVRSESRLLVLDRATRQLTDSRFSRLGDFLRPDDCLVLNDTRVLPARFFAHRQTGGRLEGLFLGTAAMPEVWQVLLKGQRRVKAGEHIWLQSRDGCDYCEAQVLAKEPEGVCSLAVRGRTNPEAVLNEVGFPPLPPYIHRDRDPDKASADRERYQTVYARHSGAVAAPTAGLHFTEALIRHLREQGVRFARVTLHVGAGTFKPIATDRVEDHPIHRESYRVDEENAAIINKARDDGGRIVAVGTTTVRTLETVAAGDRIAARAGTTDLFLTPGSPFQIVNAMITNFHLPKSTLLALVAAFAGLEEIHRAYRHAIEQRYRFYSYGDAMLIL